METQEFLKLKEEGFTNQKIANLWQVSLSTLKRFIKNNNLTTKKKDIDKERFIILYNEGKRDEEIASILEISKTSITSYRKNLNLLSQTDKLREINKLKFIELFKQGLNDSEISRILKVNNVTIHNWRNDLIKEDSNFRYSRKFDIDKFLQLYNEGFNYKEISEKLNVSDSAIQNYASSLGLTPNNYCKDVPTEEQKQIIIGSLLGDMSLKMPKGAIHASGDFAHSLKQENYCKFIEQKLRNFCTDGFYKSQFDNRINKTYESYYVYMKASDYLTILYNKFYINGTKIVPKDLLYSLDGRGIAIWYMDDGYKSDSTYHLSTNCFSLEDLETIKEFFKLKYNIEITIHKSHVIRISAKSAKIFKELIQDYIHPDCAYKMATLNSVKQGNSQGDNPVLNS